MVSAARYVFDENARVQNKDKGDAQIVGERLDTIAARNGGRLQPRAVIEDARKRSSPLHVHFEWSDKAAADEYRVQQARELIRSVRIVAPDDGPPHHAYHSILADEGRAYRALGEILTSRSLQISLMKQADRELDLFCKRYRELAEVCKAVVRARDVLVSDLATVETEAPPPRRKRGRAREARPS